MSAGEERATLREQVVAAIISGFSENEYTCRSEVCDDHTAIWVGPHPEPIVVEHADVQIPPSLEFARDGIGLDVRAILAENEAEVS